MIIFYFRRLRQKVSSAIQLKISSFFLLEQRMKLPLYTDRHDLNHPSIMNNKKNSFFFFHAKMTILFIYSFFAVLYSLRASISYVCPEYISIKRILFNSFIVALLVIYCLLFCLAV